MVWEEKWSDWYDKGDYRCRVRYWKTPDGTWAPKLPKEEECVKKSEEERFLEKGYKKEETSFKLPNDQEITIRPDDMQFGIPVAPEWYTWWRKGTPIGVHKEDKFQPQNRFAFSPLPYQPMSLEGAALLLIIANFARTPEGQKQLKDIIVKYLDSCAKIVSSVEGACHSNWLTALNNQHITAAIAHRIGLIDDGGYLKIVDHYRSVFDKMFMLGVTDAFASTLSGMSTFVQGSESKTTTKEGMTTTEMGGLAALVKAIGAGA